MAAGKGTWVAGASVLAVGALVGTWFVGIGPSLSQASDLAAQTEATRQQNVVLEQKLRTLEQDFDRLPQYQADLDALRVGIPTDVELAAFLDEIDAIASAYGVTVTDVTPQAPQGVGDAASEAGAATAPDATAGTEGAAPAATAAPGADQPTPAPSTAPADAAAPAQDAGTVTVPNLPPAVANMVAVPISLTVLGPFPGAVAFLSDIQEKTSRLMLVTGITGLGQGDEEAAQGKPATHRGDIELAVTGYLWVLPEEGGPAGDGAAPDSGSVPQGDVGTNPVAPNA